MVQYVLSDTARFAGSTFDVGLNGKIYEYDADGFTPAAGVLAILDDAEIPYELAVKGSATGDIIIPGGGARQTIIRNGVVEQLPVGEAFTPATDGVDVVTILDQMGVTYELEYAEQALVALTAEEDPIEIDDDALEDAVVITLVGKNTDSTLSFSDDDESGMFKLVGVEVQVTDVTLVADTYDVTITETLPGATGSPKATTFAITVNVAA